VCAATKVNFEVYIAYSNEEQKQIRPFYEGGMLTATLIITVIWLVLYNSRFANVRTRRFTFIAIIARGVGTLMFSFIVDPETTPE